MSEDQNTRIPSPTPLLSGAPDATSSELALSGRRVAAASVGSGGNAVAAAAGSGSVGDDVLIGFLGIPDRTIYPFTLFRKSRYTEVATRIRHCATASFLCVAVVLALARIKRLLSLLCSLAAANAKGTASAGHAL